MIRPKATSGRRLRYPPMASGVISSALRSVLAVVVGLVLISLIVELVEFGLVTMAHGAVTTDPVVYFGVRNRPWLLAAKLVYNTAAAVLAGYVTARLARRAPLAHGLALALLQTAAFAWALANVEIRKWTPDWMWIALILVTFAGIMAGARLRLGRR